MQCGYITVPVKFNKKDKQHWHECQNDAKWLSPERIHTNGKLMVCDFHKQFMEKEYREAKQIAVFKLIKEERNEKARESKA